jgi:methylenetetrahydrofolate--tRNA-(uracil-5-)-methyltransferase
MLGALQHYLATAEPGRFQPMNSNFGLLPPLPEILRKDERKARLAARARADFLAWIEAQVAPLTPDFTGTP